MIWGISRGKLKTAGIFSSSKMPNADASIGTKLNVLSCSGRLETFPTHENIE